GSELFVGRTDLSSRQSAPEKTAAARAGLLWRCPNFGNAGRCPNSARARAVLKNRVVNVVDLMKLQPPSEHPHGLSDADFDSLFTKNKPIIFAFHGYPWLIHRLTYRRTNHDNLHVRGYKEEGTITTPFDMCVLNDLDRLHLVGDVIDRVPGLAARAAYVKQALQDKLIEHKHYIREYGEDLPEIRNWKWKTAGKASPGN